MSLTHHKFHYVSNSSGWKLELKQCRPPTTVHKRRNPIAIIPGYGMNSFIFGYHPRGPSMEEYFREHGFEVWSVNLRNQGGSKRVGGGRRYGLADLGTVDLDAAVEYVAKKSQSETGKVDLIGCSLGGTIAFIYSALVPNHRAGSLVAIGAPLRWEKVHPFLKTAFCSPRIVGLLPIAGTKEILRLLSPVLLRSRLARIYLHREIVDLRRKDLFFETVEDPNRFMNAEIARWIKTKDLILDGQNVTEEFRKMKNPLLCVVANSDGIVPPMTALSAEEISGSKIKETLVVGTDKLRFAHADLFISNYSHDLVFKPIAEWLLKVSRSG